MTLPELARKIARTFNINELKSLCYDLGIEPEELLVGTRSNVARELVEYCKRRGKLESLVNQCTKSRPAETWHFDETWYLSESIPTQKPNKNTSQPKLLYWTLGTIVIVLLIFGFMNFLPSPFPDDVGSISNAEKSIIPINAQSVISSPQTTQNTPTETSTPTLTSSASSTIIPTDPFINTPLAPTETQTNMPITTTPTIDISQEFLMNEYIPFRWEGIHTRYDDGYSQPVVIYVESFVQDQFFGEILWVDVNHIKPIEGEINIEQLGNLTEQTRWDYVDQVETEGQRIIFKVTRDGIGIYYGRINSMGNISGVSFLGDSIDPVGEIYVSIEE